MSSLRAQKGVFFISPRLFRPNGQRLLGVGAEGYRHPIGHLKAWEEAYNTYAAQLLTEVSLQKTRLAVDDDLGQLLLYQILRVALFYVKWCTLPRNSGIESKLGGSKRLKCLPNE